MRFGVFNAGTSFAEDISVSAIRLPDGGINHWFLPPSGQGRAAHAI
jgi:hypothetical protein